MKCLVVFSLIAAATASSYVNFTLEIHEYQADQNEHQSSIEFNNKRMSPRFGSGLIKPLQRSSTLVEWTAFKAKFDKRYDPNEDQRRFKIYTSKMREITKHNERYLRNEVSYELGVNQFTDLLHDEIMQTMTGYNNTLEDFKLLKSVSSQFIAPANVVVADSVDWRTQGAVTPVKDQGRCGSCWSFGAVGTLEGQYFRKTGKLVSLSAQNLVDCSKQNKGCGGGNPARALEFIKNQGGVDTDSSYPYEARDGQCRFNRNNIGAKVTGYKYTKENDENDLMKAVASVGPVAVFIDASRQSFQSYNSGVYYDSACSSNGNDLRHIVLVVGYGKDNNYGDYWLVKNSWSTRWGEQGYVRMARNKNNHCGIAKWTVYPTV